MTALATGGVRDTEKGWRVALRYALGDTAQNELLKPRTLARKLAADGQATLPLFED